MTDSLPIILVPGLLASPRLYAGQLPDLWRLGSVTIADHRRDDSMSAIARRVLATAPPRFALAGLSMGGYAALEIMRQAGERVVKLALLDTSARPDTAEQSAQRRERVATAQAEGIDAVALTQFERLVHPSHRGDEHLRGIVRTMAAEVGVEGFVKQQAAIIGRADSRPFLGEIRCPTLVLVGDCDELTPPDLAAEMAHAIPGARLVTVPESGHLSTLEQPAAVTRALLDLLAS
jgi:pimeloyl-ACP methyl ester carboxylesterase